MGLPKFLARKTPLPGLNALVPLPPLWMRPPERGTVRQAMPANSDIPQPSALQRLRKESRQSIYTTRCTTWIPGVTAVHLRYTTKNPGPKMSDPDREKMDSELTGFSRHTARNQHWPATPDVVSVLTKPVKSGGICTACQHGLLAEQCTAFASTTGRPGRSSPFLYSLSPSRLGFFFFLFTTFSGYALLGRHSY